MATGSILRDAFLDVTFLIPDEPRRTRCERPWRNMLGDHVITMSNPKDTCRVAAAAVSLTEGAVADLDELAKALEKQGESQRDIGAVVRALTPYAATIGRDGAPPPPMKGSDLPAGDGRSGHRRR